jgi:hypothetical protein
VIRSTLCLLNLGESSRRSRRLTQNSFHGNDFDISWTYLICSLSLISAMVARRLDTEPLQVGKR